MRLTLTERLVALAEEMKLSFGEDPAPVDDSIRGIWILISAATRMEEWGESETAEQVYTVARRHMELLQEDNG